MGRKYVRGTKIDIETVKANLPAEYLRLSKEERERVLQTIENGIDIVKCRQRACDYDLEKEYKLRNLISAIRYLNHE